MITLPPDTPEDESSGVFAPADSEPAETPPAVTIMPPSPEDVARDNARGGRWAMNEYYDGCVLLGADDKPVMRNDGSRVGFFFRDAQRLADELAAGSEPRALPSGNDADDRAAAWRAQRRALAPLDSGFNKDWDPQRPKSTLADMTKWTRLLAYHLRPDHRAGRGGAPRRRRHLRQAPQWPAHEFMGARQIQRGDGRIRRQWPA